MSKRSRERRESVRDPVAPEPEKKTVDADSDDACQREGDATCAARANGACLVYPDARCPVPASRRRAQPFYPPGYRP